MSSSSCCIVLARYFTIDSTHNSHRKLLRLTVTVNVKTNECISYVVKKLLVMELWSDVCVSTDVLGNELRDNLEMIQGMGQQLTLRLKSGLDQIAPVTLKAAQDRDVERSR